jgi:hypothetical protein
MAVVVEHHSDAPQTQGLSQGEGGQTTIWLDELLARGQKWLRLGTLAGELPGISRVRWREIVEACDQQVVPIEVVEQD